MSDNQPLQEESPGLDPGAVLARERSRLGISLEDASRRLRLATTTLQRIEQGELDSFSPAYLRGYVTNYSRLLEMDPEPLLRSLAKREPEPLRTVLPVDRTGQRMDRFVRLATYALVTTLIVPPLVYFFVQGGASLLEGDPRGRDPVESVATADAVVSEVIDVDGSQANPVTKRPDTGDDRHLSASALLLPAMRRPHDAIEDVAPEQIARESVVEPDPRSVLELTLLDDCWVEIESADGKRLEFDLLKAGQQHRYSGMAPFRLLLGRANAVGLVLDGEPVELESLRQAGVAQLEVGASRVQAAAGEG